MKPKAPRLALEYTRAELLPEILRQVQTLDSLQPRFLASVPEEIRPHCRLIRLADGVAVLEAASAAWATRLRFLTATLIERLNTGLGQEVRALRVRVRKPQDSASAATPRPRPISACGRACLDAAARSIGDEALARVFRDLASRS